MVLLLTFSNLIAQTKHKQSETKDCCMTEDCCMMKGGKMMVIKDGKTIPMNKTMKMKNGTICKTNGECTMKDGKKMTIKNGDCIKMSGEMCCDKMEMMDKKKTTKADANVYSCPMHPEVLGAKGDKCPKCGMVLVKA